MDPGRGMGCPKNVPDCKSLGSLRVAESLLLHRTICRLGQHLAVESLGAHSSAIEEQCKSIELCVACRRRLADLSAEGA